MNTKSFDEILNEKLRNHSEKQDFQSSYTFDSAEFNWTLLLNPEGTFNTTSRHKKSQNVNYKMHQLPPFPLNPAENQAFETLKHMGARLDNRFSKRDLKSQYRRLALKNHPDQGGSAENFRLIKEAFVILENSLQRLFPRAS